MTSNDPMEVYEHLVAHSDFFHAKPAWSINLPEAFS